MFPLWGSHKLISGFQLDESEIPKAGLVFMASFSSLHTSWQDSLPSRKQVTVADIMDAVLFALGPLVSRVFCS